MNQRSMDMSEVLKALVQISMTRMSDLPINLVEEILCRVPAISLERLRSTCKKWNRLYNDKGFAKKHSDKVTKQLMFLLLTEDFKICPMSVNLHGTIPSVEVKSELSRPVYPHSNISAQFQIDQVIHCDGFLLCIPDDESVILVWNPLTGQTKWIEPNSRPEIGLNHVLGYYHDNKSSSKSYKMLSFSIDNQDSQIYDFNSDSWKILVDVVPNCAVGYTDHIVSLKGNAYWFGRDNLNTHAAISLLGFDFSTEKSSGLVPLPYQYPYYDTVDISVVREEKLSLLLRHMPTSKTEVWVTDKIDDTQVFSWSKVLALDLSPDLQIPAFGSFLLDEEEKKVIMCCERCADMEDADKSNLMIHIVEEDNIITQMNFKVNEADGGCWPAILTYVPSLAQI